MKFTDKIKSFFTGRSAISDELFDDLADLLVEGDFGPREAMEVIEQLREQGRKEKFSPTQLPEKLALLLENSLTKAAAPLLPFNEDLAGRITVILLLGVNGVGKTTTAAKLANIGREKFGLKPILAAAS